MRLCYVDEPGKADTLTLGDRNEQPVVVIGGIAIPEQGSNPRLDRPEIALPAGHGVPR